MLTGLRDGGHLPLDPGSARDRHRAPRPRGRSAWPTGLRGAAGARDPARVAGRRERPSAPICANGCGAQPRCATAGCRTASSCRSGSRIARVPPPMPRASTIRSRSRPARCSAARSTCVERARRRHAARHRPQDRQGARAEPRGGRRRQGAPADALSRYAAETAARRAGRVGPALLLHRRRRLHRSASIPLDDQGREHVQPRSASIAEALDRGLPRPPRRRWMPAPGATTGRVRTVRGVAHRRASRAIALAGLEQTAEPAVTLFDSRIGSLPPVPRRCRSRRRWPPISRDATRSASALDTTLVVEAAAGTGKTTELVHRMVAMLDGGRARAGPHRGGHLHRGRGGRAEAAPSRPRSKDARLDPAALGAERAAPDRGAAKLEEARIGTIHSFCADLLRERPVEAERRPGVRGRRPRIGVAPLVRTRVRPLVRAAARRARPGRAPHPAPLEARADVRPASAATRARAACCADAAWHAGRATATFRHRGGATRGFDRDPRDRRAARRHRGRSPSGRSRGDPDDWFTQVARQIATLRRRRCGAPRRVRAARLRRARGVARRDPPPRKRRHWDWQRLVASRTGVPAANWAQRRDALFGATPGSS